MPRFLTQRFLTELPSLVRFSSMARLPSASPASARHRGTAPLPPVAAGAKFWCRLAAGILLFGVFGLACFVLAHPAAAQSFSLNLGDQSANGGLTSRVFQIIALTTVLSLAPGILMMVTSFTRIVIVLSLLRSALGTQTTPPNVVLVSLAIFLTVFVMAPTFEKAYDTAISPLLAQQIDEKTAIERVTIPFRDFMLSQVREKDLRLFMDLANIEEVAEPQETPLQVLIPAFMIGEMRRAFEMGFLLFVPFLIIDMVVASILMSMGMMMLPPVMIALPFKLIFFVLVDGWYLVAGSLVRSFTAGS
jgi:flagellar biosynthetic protein FliP